MSFLIQHGCPEKNQIFLDLTKFQNTNMYTTAFFLLKLVLPCSAQTGFGYSILGR